MCHSISKMHIVGEGPGETPSAWRSFTYLINSLLTEKKKGGASLVTQTVKHLPAMWETSIRSLGQEDPLEKEMATHSSTLPWKIPRMEEPGRLQYMES